MVDLWHFAPSYDEGVDRWSCTDRQQDFFGVSLTIGASILLHGSQCDPFEQPVQIAAARPLAKRDRLSTHFVGSDGLREPARKGAVCHAKHYLVVQLAAAVVHIGRTDHR